MNRTLRWTLEGIASEAHHWHVEVLKEESEILSETTRELEELEDQEPNDPGDLGAVAAGVTILLLTDQTYRTPFTAKTPARRLVRYQNGRPRVVSRCKFKKRRDDLVGCADLGWGEA